MDTRTSPIRKISSSLILTLAASCYFLQAQVKSLPEVVHTSIGLSSSGIKSMDSLMERYTQPDRFPCAMLMVARDGKIGYWKAFGVRDIETNNKLDRNDLFRIYSITKPITSVAAMILWEQGKIRLDDPVEKHIPSFKKLQVYDQINGLRKPIRKMTIRHLLNFSSGLTYGYLDQKSRVDTIMANAALFVNATNLTDLVERLSDLPIVNDPGETVSYGFQTDILGRIIEIASGLSLDKYFQDNIFKPLGMTETGFQISAHQLNRYPALYNITNDGSVRKEDPNDTTSHNFKDLDKRSYTRFLCGGCGLVSTPFDYMRFAQMLANKGEFNGMRLLKASTVEMMTTPNVIKDLSRQNSLQGPGWLPGFQVLVTPDVNATTGGGHNGLYWMAGAPNLYFWVDPTTNIVALIWAQTLPYKVFPIFDDARKVVHNAFEN